MRGQLTSPEAVRNYLLAGHATFTVQARESGKRFTFKFDRPEAEPGRDRPVWVKVMDGSNNETDFAFLGTLWPRTNGWEYKRSPKSRVSDQALSAKAAKWLLGCLTVSEAALLTQAEVWHEGHCGRCGRKLTVPESIETGLGPECAKRSAA